MTPFLLLLAAAGQTTTPGAILIDRGRLDRAPTAPAPATGVGAAGPILFDDEARAVRIAGIRFVGAQAPAPVARAGASFLGQRATKATLTKLAAALSAGYGQSDVALYTASIPAQSFANGVVIVRLTEGRIVRAQVVAADPDAYPQLRERLAPLTEERPLSQGTFERQFSLMRSIPGLTVNPAFTDPQGTGDLVLTVTPKQKRTRLTAGFSNRGVDLLGDGELDIRGELNGAAIDGDQLAIAASAATDLKRYRLVTASYAAPIGGSGLTASASATYLATRPRGYDISGEAEQAALTIAYPLVRRFTRSADVSLGLDGLNSDNAAFGNLVTRERSRAVRLAGGYAISGKKRSLSAGASLSHGLDILDAGAPLTAADITFLKATANVSAAQAIGKRGALRVTASGQWSNDALPAAERFALGGAGIGRAFDIAVLTGDRGAGGSVELAWRPVKATRFAASEVYGFTDYGALRVVSRAGFAGRNFDLASAGVGARARYRDKAELGLEVARAIKQPYPGYRERWRLSVSWRVSA